MIASFLAPEVQGWYYSFISVTALYTLFDLGLSVVLVQISAHMSVGLSWLPRGELTGENAFKFMALVGKCARHYVLLALAFSALVIPGGTWLFGHGPGPFPFTQQWLAPWVVLSGLTSIGITLIPFLSIVEGSGDVAEVYTVRLVHGILGSIACWVVLATGGGLWATTAVPAMGLLISGGWLVIMRPYMLAAAIYKVDIDLSWREKIWPLQWRVGLSWLSGYLLTQIYTPVLLYYQGAVVAGQMGLSLSVANMTGILAQSWIARHVPLMAQAAAKREWLIMSQIFRNDLCISSGFFLLGAIVLCLCHKGLGNTQYAGRMLGFWPFVGLLVITLINHLIGAMASQLRSYQREPLVWVSVAGALMTAPVALFSASYYSADEVITTIIGVQLLLTLPASFWIWKKSNRVLRISSIR